MSSFAGPAAHDASDTRIAVHGAGWVVVQRLLHVVEGTLFAVAVPRLMGPVVFGQYALLVSVSLWFALLSSLGAVSMMTRGVPGLVVRGDAAGLQKLVSGLLGLRAATGVGAALLYVAATATWLHEFDTFSLACIAGAVFCRTTSNLLFALFLGLNRAARWGSGELLRKWSILVLVAAGYLAGGLRGACAGFFAANATVLAIGLWGSRAYVRVSRLWPDLRFLAPFLRTGAAFTGGNLLLAIAQRSGETVVRATTGDYAQVAFYGAALAIYMAGAQAMWSVAIAFAPMLVARSESGDRDEVAWWLEQLLTWTLILAAMAFIGVALAADDLVPLLLGHAYDPVARNLLPLVLALLARAPANIARLKSLVADRPGDAAVAAGLELVTFVGLGVLLSRQAGSLGACLAVLAGSSANAAYLWLRMRGTFPFPARKAALTVAALVPLMPLAWVHAAWVVELPLLAIAYAGFAALLLAGGVVRRDDAERLLRVVRAPRGVPESV